MERHIELKDKKVRKMIINHFEVTSSNLTQALRFKRNSKQAIAMRKMAIENGGVLFESIAG